MTIYEGRLRCGVVSLGRESPRWLQEDVALSPRHHLHSAGALSISRAGNAQQAKMGMSSWPHAAGTAGLGPHQGCVCEGGEQPLGLLQTCCTRSSSWERSLGEVGAPSWKCRLPSSSMGGPTSGPQKELELGQILPWQQTRTCRLSRGAQTRPQHSACHPGAVIPHRGLGLGAHPPLQVHKPQPRVTALRQEDGGFLLALCPGTHCGVPEPPSPRLHQPGLRGLLLQPHRHGAGSWPLGQPTDHKGHAALRHVAVGSQQ